MNAYSRTISSNDYANQPDHPALLPFQLVEFVAPAGVSQYLLTPQGTNVVASPQGGLIANLVTDADTQGNVWCQVELRPSPSDPTKPMTLTAPILQFPSAPATVVQVN